MEQYLVMSIVPPGGACNVRGHCGRSVHAEVNAVLQALALAAEKVPGSTAYVTHYPCFNCLSILAQAGVSKVFYAEEYGSLDIRVSRLLNVLGRKRITCQRLRH